MSSTPQPEQAAAVKTPHRPLTDYYQTEADRAGFVKEMFDTTGEDYDRVENILAFGTGAWYRGQALRRAGLAQGMRVLDVGFGTGLVAVKAVEIIGAANLLTGLDPSPGMMRASPLLNDVSLIEGRAEAIPFPDDSFDFISMGYALRHMSDLEKVFSEFHRVLKPGGKICILEIPKPDGALATFALKTYMRYVVPTIAKIVSKSNNTSLLWQYYWDSIEACAPPQQILDTLSAVGFVGVKRHREIQIFSEYQGQKPR